MVQGSVVQSHRKLAMQRKDHANQSQSQFPVVQKRGNLYGARTHNTSHEKIAEGLELLQVAYNNV
jgi:hypothetical protein